MRISVQVTKADIKNGVAEESDSCPIALATRRAVKKLGFNEVEVDGHITITNDTTRFVFDTKKNVKNFIQRFDNDLPVKPMRIRLEKGDRSTKVNGYWE